MAGCSEVESNLLSFCQKISAVANGGTLGCVPLEFSCFVGTRRGVVCDAASKVCTVCIIHVTLDMITWRSREGRREKIKCVYT